MTACLGPTVVAIRAEPRLYVQLRRPSRARMARARGQKQTATAASHGFINAEVARHIDEVQIFELNNNLQKAIASDNKVEVQRVMRTIRAMLDEQED